VNLGQQPAHSLTAETEGHFRARLHRLCPQFTPAGPFTCTETSTLLAGHIGPAAVIAKHLIDPRPFWQARARHEASVYRILAAAGPAPVPLPRLLASDPRALMIVLTVLPGSQVCPDRYPVPPLPAAHMDELLRALSRLHRWDAPALRRIPADTDYAAQYAGLPADLFRPGELERHAATTSTLTGALGTQLEHGDAHPGNAITAPRAPLALIDLEFLAPRLPGYDLAMLWTLTGPDPDLRTLITRHAGPDPRRITAFWLSTVLVLGREILSHRRYAPTALHRDRLSRLQHDLVYARNRLSEESA